MQYPIWALNRASIKQKNTSTTNQYSSNSKNNTGCNNNKPHIVVPYVKGMSESCKNICWKYGIEVYFKGGSTIKDLLVHPKDKDTILQKSEVIYRYKCGRVDCKEEYIGELGRTFVEGSENIQGPPHPSMTTMVPLVMTFSGKFQHCRQGGPKYCQIHQRGNTN